MSDRIGTHWDECWREHIGCAVAEVEAIASCVIAKILSVKVME